MVIEWTPHTYRTEEGETTVWDCRTETALVTYALLPTGHAWAGYFMLDGLLDEQGRQARGKNCASKDSAELLANRLADRFVTLEREAVAV